jgi:anthranilate phosphoribosyltransferase
MNVLGPLTNPAGARRQVVGVADADLIPLIAGAFRDLVHLRALVVHGVAGMDEVSPIGPTRVAEVRDGEVHEYEISPADLGVDTAEASELAGGEPDDNAAIIESVLAGSRGGPRSAVVLNAAAAILVADRASDWAQAVALAERAIDDGSARQSLDALRAASNRD